MPQDTEDVAAKCFDLAPNRFSWRKYPYPNLESTGVALRDGKKQKNGALINGSSRIGWLLSPAGVDWAQNQDPLLAPADTGTPRLALRREQAAAIDSIRSHTTFKVWQTDANNFVSLYETADAVRLTADAPRVIIAQRIDELSNIARMAGLQEMLEFLSWLKMSADRAY